MAAQLPTVLCIMAAALIHLPDAQSRTTQPARYDAARELTEKFDEKYYLVQRSHYIDRKMGNSASCVSVLKLTPLFWPIRYNCPSFNQGESIQRSRD
uniref:Putative secreted protein n=1 Tax=Ixodes ricinus TaxID=34613 RepID=V5GP95_IXORI